MKIFTRFILGVTLTCIFGWTSAQVPTNDNCSGAISLISNAGCTSGTVYQATTQGGESTNLPCTNGNTAHTVWYSFVATSSKMYVQIYETSLIGNGNGYTDDRWAIEVYNTGTCPPAQNSQISCVNTNSQGNHDNIMKLNFTTLTVGSTYLIQIAYKPGNGAQVPNFCIQVGDNYSATCNTCSGSCGAACILSSVPATNSVVTNTCSPHNLMPYLEGDESTTECYTFTATSTIMNFGLVINSTCSGSNTASFSWNSYNSGCSSMQTGTGSSKVMTGLTVGQSYSFCYTLKVPSDCYHTAYYPYVYPNQTLPVELTTFVAKQNDNGVILDWVTESELNNLFFIVQRSEDGLNFSDITVIDGHGTSTVQHSYTYTDSLPVKGTAYYRLKQIDLFVQDPEPVWESNGTNDAKLKTEDGNDDDVTSVNFSHVVSASFLPEQSYDFNLKGDKAEISLYHEGQSMVMIFDEQGIVIYRQVVSEPTQLQVPISNKHGIWYACLIDGNHKELMRAF